MRPPACLPLLLLAACDLEPLPPDTDLPGTPPESGCAVEGWVRARSAEVFVTQFVLDSVGSLAGVDPAATYDGVPAVCVDPAGGGVEFFFEIADEPFGRVRMVTSNTGSLDLGVDGEFVVDLFGADVPVTFRSTDWIFGGWDVSSLKPFETLVSNAQAERDGRVLAISITASVAP